MATHNPEAWNSLLQQLQARTDAAKAMGGEDKIARQHSRNRQTARERIDILCDSASFSEIGALAGGNHPGGAAAVPGDGLVGGTGRVHGRSVVVMAEDFTVKGGSIGHPNAAKRARLVRMAAEQQLPLVLMLDGAGERATNGSERYPVAPGDLQLVADLKGQVPVVTLVMGTSAGHGALTGMFADLIIMTAGSAMFTAGPPLVKAALGIDATAEELGGAQMHTAESGVAHNLANSEAEAVAMARYFLSMLPARAGGKVPESREAPAAQPRAVDQLMTLIPPQVNLAYDMRDVLQELVDSQTLFELQPAYGRTMIVALARIGGVACMIVANQPAVMAGAITAAGAYKATHFIDVAAAFGLPLLSLLDNPGVLPGAASEREGVLRAAGQMFAAQRRYRGRKVVATLRKAFGFGSSVMGMNPWDRQTISLALPSVTLGGVPAIGGAEATRASAEESAQMQELQSGAWVPADAMAFDKVIAPGELRNEIIQALYLD
ncbi:acyl-CoA carboxylase subunit beta [Candidatus Litorirhabdus singularis]|uniref:acyl-CoA carboxylase subunit beta n=1 Tax=Candidatus Litorirhabdus singularis TaxID=2518993 RepID=UPI0024329BC9|nr:carboxyl transferase domain-containing protein [Candidatus Litorirhabdus singularis]